MSKRLSFAFVLLFGEVVALAYCDTVWNKLTNKQRVLLADSIFKKKSVLVIGSDTTDVASFTTWLLSKNMNVDEVSMYTGSDSKELQQVMMYDPASMCIPAINDRMYKPLIDYLRHGGFGLFGIISKSIDLGVSDLLGELLPINHSPIEKASIAYELGQYIEYIIDINDANNVELYKYNGYASNTNVI